MTSERDAAATRLRVSELDVRLRAAKRKLRRARRDLSQAATAWVRLTTTGPSHAAVVAIPVAAVTCSALLVQLSYDIWIFSPCSVTDARLSLAWTVAAATTGAAILFATWRRWLSRRRARVTLLG